MDSIANKYHRDGTVTYWSVYRQTWVYRASAISDREMAAMSESERAKIHDTFTKAFTVNREG